MKKPKKSNRPHRGSRNRKSSSKRSASGRRAERSQPSFLTLQSEIDGSEPTLHDDCPHCRAMAELGIEPNSAISLDQLRRMKTRSREIAQEEGLFEGVGMMAPGLLDAESLEDLPHISPEDMRRAADARWGRN